MHMSKRKKATVGFSFVEITLVLIIFTSLITALITLAPVDTKKAAEISTENRIKHIERAIRAFYNQNGYLPCPAPLDTGLNINGFAISSNCAAAPPAGTTDFGSGNDRIRSGMIPTRSLDLPDAYAFDAWNDRIVYVVIAGLAQSKVLFDGYTTVLGTSQPIVVKDEHGNQKHNNNNSTLNPNVVAFAILSNGRTAEGATNYTGTSLIAACVATTLDSENCNGNNIFIDAPHNYTAGATYYDDYLLWRTLSAFKGEVNYQSLSTASIVEVAIITDRNNPTTESEPWSVGGRPMARPLRTISGNSGINAVTLNKSLGTTSVSSTGNAYSSEVFFPTTDTTGTGSCDVNSGCGANPVYDPSSVTLPSGKYNINALVTVGYNNFLAADHATTNAAGVGAAGIISGATTIWGFPNQAIEYTGGLDISTSNVPVYSYWNVVGASSFGLMQISENPSRMGWSGSSAPLTGYSTSDVAIVPQTYYIEIWKY